ncbi:MAG: hypothetical protein ACFBWO_13180 [Paracoccaceae bacterium]
MGEREERIAAALCRLPHKDGAQENIEGVTQAIIFIAGLYRTQEAPRFRGASQEAAMKQLVDLGATLIKAREEVSKLSGPAFEALPARDLHILRKLMDDMVNKISDVLDDGSVDDRPIRGAKKKISTAAVSDYCANHFKIVVGREPTVVKYHNGRQYCAGGPFIELLTEVFSALGIEDSVPSQAEAAIARMQRKAP